MENNSVQVVESNVETIEEELLQKRTQLKESSSVQLETVVETKVLIDDKEPESVETKASIDENVTSIDENVTSVDETVEASIEPEASIDENDSVDPEPAQPEALMDDKAAEVVEESPSEAEEPAEQETQTTNADAINQTGLDDTLPLESSLEETQVPSSDSSCSSGAFLADDEQVPATLREEQDTAPPVVGEEEEHLLPPPSQSSQNQEDELHVDEEDSEKEDDLKRVREDDLSVLEVETQASELIKSPSGVQKVSPTKRKRSS